MVALSIRNRSIAHLCLEALAGQNENVQILRL